MPGMNTATHHPEGSIDTSVTDGVLQITINRPAKRNGFTPKMFRELGEAYTRLDDDPDLRVGLLVADIVVAADDCRFSQLEVARGIMATGGATLRMAERAGMGNALLHLLTGDVFDSMEALRLNFVQKVVPAGQERAEALRIAQQIAAQAPLAVVATRQNVLKGVEHGPLVAMQDFIGVQQRLSRSEDAAEGVRSFVEKRAARFSGR